MTASHSKSRATATSALAASAATTSSAKSTSTSTNMPFRDLLLHSKYSLEAKITTSAESSVALPNSATDVMSSADEHERLVLATHFHERDRLILQHQRQQLQQKQRSSHADVESAFVGSDRIRDFVIDGGAVDRPANKSPGKYEKN